MTIFHKFRLFYVPFWQYLLIDMLMLAISFFVVLMWFPLSTQVPFTKYWIFALVFSAEWLIISYFTHRYIRVKKMRMGELLARLAVAAVMQFCFMLCYMYLISPSHNFSIFVLLTIWLVMLVTCLVYIILSHAYQYATYAEPEVERAPERGPQSVLHPAEFASEERANEIRESIIEEAGPEALAYLEKHISLFSSNTITLASQEIYNFKKLKYFNHDTIVNFMPLNQIRGINQMFGVVNDKLPDNGLFVCCFEPKSTTKKKILQRYPRVINRIVYAFVYLYKRVFPRLVMTSRLYFDITEGKNRILSRAEVLGRLCYCGFEIVDDHKVGDLRYVIARRSFRPQSVATKLYGLLIRLNRVGKDGREFQVYKFRTMHPYSEYLQAYIYQQYGLKESGKFSHDIRITTLGKCLRKNFIDEWPMIINVLAGDLKLVGVRPISKQYLSLYSPELQEKRMHHKPGLLPPFYADMPKTLPEIEASEMRYLTACEEQGKHLTDLRYFGKILYNILFKRARSN